MARDPMLAEEADDADQTILPTERSALLRSKSVEDVCLRSPLQKAATPVPWRSVSCILLGRLCEPIAFCNLFPYVNAMIADTGVDPAKVGYQSGVLEMVFTLTQFCTILQWGRLSDRIGRKPVLIFGLLGVAISMILFGMSRTFVMMMITRALSGALNGNVGIIKASLGELTDPTNEAKAFGLLPPAWTIGASFGQALGGFLADPARQYPNVFGNIRFFQVYKYALPNLVSGMFPLFGACLAFFYLEESLPKHRRKLSLNQEAGASVPPTTSGSTSLRNVITKRVALTLSNYAVLAFTSMSIVAIVPLWMYTPVHLGGLGFSEAQIGTALSLQSIVTAITQLAIFQPLQQYLGSVGCFRVVAWCYPTAALMFPIVSYIAAHQSPDSGDTHIWIGIASIIFLLAVANVCYSCNMLIINASAPSRMALATLHGVSQMTSALVRSMALAVSPALFAYTINTGLVHGQAVWIFLVVMGCCLCASTWFLSSEEAAWRNQILEGDVNN